jgi:hypothetical protein
MFFLFMIRVLPLEAKLPFHPRDVLPLLPRQASWPIINSLYSPVDLLPTFVGAASSPNDTLEWKGACFYENRAWMEFHNKSGTEFGGGTLHIKVWNLSLLACFLLFGFSWFCWILEYWVSGYRSLILLVSGIELGFLGLFCLFCLSSVGFVVIWSIGYLSLALGPFASSSSIEVTFYGIFLLVFFGFSSFCWILEY